MIKTYSDYNYNNKVVGLYDEFVTVFKILNINNYKIIVHNYYIIILKVCTEEYIIYPREIEKHRVWINIVHNYINYRTNIENT